MKGMSVAWKYRTALASLFLLTLGGCDSIHPIHPGPDAVAVHLRFVGETTATKTGDPDASLISDVNLFLFTPDGFLTDRLYFSGDSASLRLPRRSELMLCACTNLGFALDGIGSLEELKAWRYYLIFPDGYARGLPRACVLERLTVGDDAMSLDLPTVPLFSRFTLSMDRTALDPQIRIRVRSARVGGCPNSITPFAPSRAESQAHLFAQGFIREGLEADPLNREMAGGRSGEIELYALENLQQERSELCSYIELDVDYQSPRYWSAGDRYLTYRFYAGEDYRVERGVQYRYLIRPRGDGLDGDGWSVDRTRLGTVSGPLETGGGGEAPGEG